MTSVDAVNAKAAAAIEEGKADNDGKSAEQIRDEIQQELWTQPGNDDNTPEFRAKFVNALSCGTVGDLLSSSLVCCPSSSFSSASSSSSSSSSSFSSSSSSSPSSSSSSPSSLSPSRVRVNVHSPLR